MAGYRLASDLYQVHATSLGTGLIVQIHNKGDLIKFAIKSRSRAQLPIFSDSILEWSQMCLNSSDIVLCLWSRVQVPRCMLYSDADVSPTGPTYILLSLAMFIKNIVTSVFSSFFQWTTDQQCKHWHLQTHFPRSVWSHRVMLLPAGSPGLKDPLVPEYAFQCILIEPLQYLSDRYDRRWTISEVFPSTTHPNDPDKLNRMACPEGSKPAEVARRGYGQCHIVLEDAGTSTSGVVPVATVAKDKQHLKTPEFGTSTLYFDPMVMRIDSLEFKCLDSPE